MAFALNWRESSSVAPYVPTPLNIVRKMLEIVEAGSDDILYDLGCGDGRILFSAVEDFNVKKAVGYELNPIMHKAVLKKVEDKGLRDRVEVINGNFFFADLSPASVITLYLTTSGNSKLKPKFESELRKGTRIVSHDFPINGWKPIKPNLPNYFDVSSHRIYLYRVPESYQEGSEVQNTSTDESNWRRIRNLLKLEKKSGA
ncbi:class I SAM-dependent methyltransferase [Candidatus Bathyarchaeota archaeon]|nr:class I SAM-dependent methyltransferase [Candidatus Bathyarchaeota archaeon]MBS7629974.1 class I SAM-dependent methyltransferase [Candidatus Bathyarchaeota archaeon]